MPSIFENREIEINSKEDIFDLWNLILEKKGPIIFDKSPKYLENMSFLNLISDYKKNHEVKIIGMIRNPLDAITSQYELWHEYTNEQDLNDRENKWLAYYNNLENFLELENDIKFIKYENLVKNHENFKELFDYCNLVFNENYTNKFQRKINERHKISMFKKIKDWKWTNAFNNHLNKYDYLNYKKKNYFFLNYLFNLKFNNWKRYIPLKIKNFTRDIFKN